MEIRVIKGDITKLEIDVIVNAANNELKGGGGVDGAIHRAGGPSILAECQEIGYCPTGEVVRTGGGDLKIKHLFHTVGPVYSGNDAARADLPSMKELLKSCYFKSLKLADELGAKTIAFPNISTGVYGYPKELALDAVEEVLEEFKTSGNMKSCIFCCFDDENYNLYIERFES